MMKQRFHQTGVTLIELMISITMGLVILAAILSLYLSTIPTSKQSEETARLSEDAAVAMNYLTGYIRMAGFSFPQANVPGNTVIQDSLAKGFIDSNLAGAGIRGCDNGFSNPKASSAALLTCSEGLGNSSISIRFEGDINNTTPSSGNPTDCLSQAITSNTPSSFTGSADYKLIESRFFVATGADSGVPELFCAGNGDGKGFTDQPIIQNVESLVIRYGIAGDATSQNITQYLTAAGVDALAGDIDQRWGRVISLRICLTMRSELKSATYVNTYRNCNGETVAPTDNLIRRTFQSLVTIRNRGGISG
jgi:type IV pilus assembly protein PilW